MTVTHQYALFIDYSVNHFFLQIIQNTFKLDEMLNACSDQLDDERKIRATVVQTLSKFEQDLADARKKL